MSRCAAPSCDVEFVPARADQRFCCRACKQRAKRAREGADTRFRSDAERQRIGSEGYRSCSPLKATNRPAGEGDATPTSTEAALFGKLLVALWEHYGSDLAFSAAAARARPLRRIAFNSTEALLDELFARRSRHPIAGLAIMPADYRDGQGRRLWRLVETG
jgi:hypothetical protein